MEENKTQKPFNVDVHGTGLVNWFYPEIYGDDKPRDAIDINLMHVRASDGIRIEYDSERDGWVIMQGSKWEWEADDPNPGDEDWQEVAFIQSWAREKK